MRMKYNIQGKIEEGLILTPKHNLGGAMDDFILSWCCAPCTMAQMKNEVKNVQNQQFQPVVEQPAKQVNI